MLNQSMRKFKRSSTPIQGTNILESSSRCPIYEDWKIYLHCSSGRHLKVRGFKNPPNNFISGHILLDNPSTPKRATFTPRIDFIDAENQHLDEIYGDKAKFIDVVKPGDQDKEVVAEDVQEVLNQAITCSRYAKQIEARNSSIKEKILPMLQKGLKKLCFPKFQLGWKNQIPVAEIQKDEVEEFLTIDRDDTSYKDTYLLVLH